MRKLSIISLAFFICLADRAVYAGKTCGVALYTAEHCKPAGTGVRDCDAWTRAECVSDPEEDCLDYSYFPRRDISVFCVQYENAVECGLGFNGTPTNVLYPDQFCVNVGS